MKLERTISEKTIEGIEISSDVPIIHDENTHSLTLAKQPGWLDAAKTNERRCKEGYLSIYSLEGDAVMWCVARWKQRPIAFKAANDSPQLILKHLSP
ncbi:MAG: hypothetical protein ACKODH_04825 [Limisphaerales bacterium]